VGNCKNKKPEVSWYEKQQEKKTGCIVEFSGSIGKSVFYVLGNLQRIEPQLLLNSWLACAHLAIDCG
jgi:hypothetical protein